MKYYNNVEDQVKELKKTVVNHPAYKRNRELHEELAQALKSEQDYKNMVLQQIFKQGSR